MIWTCLWKILSQEEKTKERINKISRMFTKEGTNSSGIKEVKMVLMTIKKG